MIEVIDHPILRTLALGFRLVEAAEAAATDPPPIALPPVYGSTEDQSQLLTVAPLYLAAELEGARLIPAVELLTGLFATGALQIEDAESGRLIEAFWMQRHQRFVENERRAFFARLFGTFEGPSIGPQGSANRDFESLMIDFTEATYKVDLDPGGGRVRAAGANLVANLLPRSGGIALFAARDVLTTISAALDIVGKPGVQHILGAHGPWGAVSATLRRYATQHVDIHSHVARGQAGTLLLAWLANHLANLDGGGGEIVGARDPIVAAAAQWLQASLTLNEQQSAPIRHEG